MNQCHPLRHHPRLPCHRRRPRHCHLRRLVSGLVNGHLNCTANLLPGLNIRNLASTSGVLNHTANPSPELTGNVGLAEPPLDRDAAQRARRVAKRARVELVARRVVRERVDRLVVAVLHEGGRRVGLGGRDSRSRD